MKFSEPEIRSLFGHEAAEDENPGRLRQYYFKNATFDKVASELPLRILVGHKGIGKSALFQIAMQEDIDARCLPILIRPDDILRLEPNATDFLKTIRDWKSGLTEIFAHKILDDFGEPISHSKLKNRLSKYGVRLVDFLIDTFRDLYKEKINLDPARKSLVEKFLRDGIIHIYIDDLDRGWQGRKDDIARISALLNAVRDLSSENRRLSFRIALRSDVYYLVRTSDESTDKIEGSVIWHTWSNFEIFALLIKRIETSLGREVDERQLLSLEQKELAKYLEPIMEPFFLGSGHWANAPIHRVLMSLIRKRPRDLVKLCTLAAREAHDAHNPRINTKNFVDSFEEYSQGRLQDTMNEFRSELPDLERLLTNMKPNKRERKARLGYVYSTSQLLEKISNISENGKFRFSSGMDATNRELASFMYKINFLTARKEVNGRIERKYFEENRYLSSSFADFGFDWEVHPAYRWALQPENISDIYSSLRLTSEV